MPATGLAGRIVARLVEAEDSEPNAHYRDDLRIARLTVAYAASGEAVLCSPHVLASYMVLGLHPDKVWPKILERRCALGIDKFLGGKLPPKKPPRPAVFAQQTICSEKKNAAKVSGQRGGEALVLCDRTNSVPMAAPSIAALFPNSDQSSSAKTRQFTYDEMLDIVRHSYVRPAVRRATLNALTARSRWPEGDGPVTGTVCVAFDGMAMGDEDGDGMCSRRTAQRRAKLACELGYWRLAHKFNRWLNCPKCGAERSSAKCADEKCGHRGRSRNRDGSTNTKEFCRPYTFEIDFEKFLTAAPPKYARRFCARTWKEHKQAGRGEHPNVIDMASRKPAQPVAEHAHRSTARPEPKPQPPAQPKLTKRETAKFMADVAQAMKGCEGSIATREGMQFVGPGDPRYRPKLNFREAVNEVAKLWKREAEVVLEALKFWGYQLRE